MDNRRLFQDVEGIQEPQDNESSLSSVDFYFRRFPFYVLYVLSYGYMIVNLYVYGGAAGQSHVMDDKTYFLLFYLTIMTFTFAWILYIFFEVDKLTLAELKYIFWSEKRGPVTPFFVMGTLSAVNYVLVAWANPHVESIYQVLASVLQLPFVVGFNWILNSEKLWVSKHIYPYRQVITWIGVFSFYFTGILLVAQKELETKFENFGWFLIYLTSTIPIPVLSVLYQSLLVPKHPLTQPDMRVYSKPSLMIAMLNFWQGVWLTLTIWLIPTVDGTSIAYSFSSGVSCLFSQSNDDPKNGCERAFFIINLLTFCVIFNFYGGLKVVTFEDANFAILIQQLGPILAAFSFSSKELMGRFYDNQSTSWRSYVSLGCILISFVMYKLNRLYLKQSTDQLGDNTCGKKTIFERMWIVNSSAYMALSE
jgi:hypothetical protein